MKNNNIIFYTNNYIFNKTLDIQTNTGDFHTHCNNHAVITFKTVFTLVSSSFSVRNFFINRSCCYMF